MAFLTINGWEVPVKIDSLQEEPERIGPRKRAIDLTLRTSTRGIKRTWKFETPPLRPDVAAALVGLLQGRGHYWSFDEDLYSSKGLGPVAGYNATQSTTGGKYGGKVDVTSLSYAAGLPAKWTILVARRSGTVWENYAVRSDGAKWLNGVRNDALSTTWLSVANGVLTLTGSPTSYDELIVLPYLAVEAQIQAFHTRAAPFSSLPRLILSGNMLGNDTVLVEGDVTDVKYVPFRDSDGVWYDNGQALTVELLEV